MTFTSLSDLYFIGTGLYALNILWQIIVDTKLLILPIIMIVLEIVKDSAESGKAMSDSGYMLKKLETRIYISFFTILFFVWPLVPFEVSNMTQYTKQCEVGEEIYIDEDLSIEDEQISGGGRLVNPIRLKPNNLMIEISGSSLKVPLALQLVMSYMSGYTVEAVDRLPCSLNMVAISKQLLNTRIKDSALLLETKEFVRQCYEPARSLAIRNRDVNLPWIEDPDTSDQSWPGHQGFMNDAYYGAVGRGFYSQVLLEGWENAKTNKFISKWSESKQSEIDGDLDCSDGTCLHKVGGFPSCREWWQGIGAGYSGTSYSTKEISLHSQLLANLPKYLGDNYLELGKLLEELHEGESVLWKRDAMIKLAYFNPVAIRHIKGAEIKDYAWNSETNAAQAVLSRTLGTFGTAGAALGNYAGASMIQLAAPIAKGIAFLVVLTAFPLAVVISKYGYKFIIPFHFFVGSLFFWPFLWDLSLLAQQSLIETTMSTGNLWIGDLTRTNTMFLGQYLTDALFLAFPSLFTGILTAAGMSVGAQMGSITSEPGGKAGSPARQTGNKASSDAVNKGKSAAKEGTKEVATKGANKGASKAAKK